ncbi:MAG: hypothetical protein HY914_16180 [Desulfomonile tiedjei]|nr:hypothetical protein [Desulfomonile tiedjei]
MGVAVELDVFLLWFSWISLVFWSAVLIWSAGTLIVRARREKQWEEHYVPTLQSDIHEYDIGSWTTLDEFEALKDRETAKHRAAAKKTRTKR